MHLNLNIHFTVITVLFKFTEKFKLSNAGDQARLLKI